MMNRQLFEFSAAGGDTGVPANGLLCQLRWNPTVVDTGNNATMVISVLPKQNDTGDGWVIYSKTGGLNANFIDAPRQAASYSGLDASGDSGYMPIAFAGDRLRVKVGSTSNIAGRLYAWFKDYE